VGASWVTCAPLWRVVAMAEPLRYRKGQRVVWQRRGDKPRRGVLTEDCAEWHSFATMRFDREREERSVWVGDVMPLGAVESEV
jgi:hypothetical protein